SLRLIVCVLCNPLCPRPRPPSARQLHDFVGLESLRGEKAVQTLELAIVRDRFASMQTLLQRRVDQRIVVDGVEDLVDGTLGDRLVDAGALNLHLHAEFAPATDARLSARNGGCNSRIVDGALLAQSRNRSVDGIRL